MILVNRLQLVVTGWLGIPCIGDVSRYSKLCYILDLVRWGAVRTRAVYLNILVNVSVDWMICDYNDW